MAKVGIIMGSDSDMAVMSKAAEVLDEFGVDYEMHIISAHREPDVLYKWAQECRENGTKVIIAGAGMAAALPGMCAALFPLPVIGIPMHTASVAIGGGKNAGLLAVKILAVSDNSLLAKIEEYNAKMKKEVEDKDARLQEAGYKNYVK